MISDLREIFPVFVNFVVPITAGFTFFAMAMYVRYIGPMRTLVTGRLTYQGAFWGFLLFGIYLATRPVQILFPHPWPLIVNNLREMCMIGIFGPAVFIAMMSLVYGAENISSRLIYGTFAAGIVLAVAFMVTNVFAIGGSEEIFSIGRFRAHDGLWFDNPRADIRSLMRILFIIRLIDPVFLILYAGTIVLWHAKTYPANKRAVYDNMPRKLYFLGAGCYAFALSMLSVGFLYLFAHIGNQWWIYYFGALAAGILETISLALPVRKEVQVSEHL